MTNDPLNEPAEVEGADGLVTINGPAVLIATMTPEAAEETGRRLIAAAAAARRALDRND